MAAYGLCQIYDGEDANVDIVFLHGLRGNMTEILWPEKLLPKDIPGSRIFLFGYDTSITHRDQSRVTKTEIHSDADDLCARLAAKRSSTSTDDRPIIFIAHSLGGLVVAQAFVHGEQRTQASDATSIARNLRGMIFLGTPFRGSSAARPAEAARKILKVLGVDTQPHTLKLLGVNSERLDELTRAFPEVLNKRRTSKSPDDRIEAFFFYETRKTIYKGVSTQVVEIDSAQLPGCGDSAPIRADHTGICKFETDNAEGYVKIVGAIRKVMLPPEAGTSQGSKTINVLGKAINVANDSINISSQTVTM